MLQSAPPPLSTHVVEQAGRGVPALALDAVMLGEEGGHLLGGHHQHGPDHPLALSSFSGAASRL